MSDPVQLKPHGLLGRGSLEGRPVGLGCGYHRRRYRSADARPVDYHSPPVAMILLFRDRRRLGSQVKPRHARQDNDEGRRFMLTFMGTIHG